MLGAVRPILGAAAAAVPDAAVVGQQPRQLPPHAAQLVLHSVDVSVGVRQLHLQQRTVRLQYLPQ